MVHPDQADVRVVLFSGGRGSGALAKLIATTPRVALTVAINGYDDGASTGEVRRFLGDALGPSDFRKNASRLARLRATCAPQLIEILDRRLPASATAADIPRLIDESAAAGFAALAERFRAFEAERSRSQRAISLGDASVGNLAFAGSYLLCGRRFNDAVDDYCTLLGLPTGLIENVTVGANAFLVALDEAGHVLGSEAEIVDARRHCQIREIFLLDRPLTPDDLAGLAALPADARRQALDARAVRPRINPRLTSALQQAHLIIYAPGTQHSSLYPSYLTDGLGVAVASNLEAVKLLVTNIQEDAEIIGRSAVDLIDQAVHYLRDKEQVPLPTPFLITHYLVNDPGRADAEKPYVPLGRLESLEDPRLVRVANYEAGSSGRHDAAKVLAPYIDAFLARGVRRQKIAVLLSDAQSLNKVSQTLLEMVRGRITGTLDELTVFHAAEGEIDRSIQERLGFSVKRLDARDEAGRDRELREALREGSFGYLVLFDSSGMYNGEDIVALVSHLTLGRLDAVWGSRRLSVRDIQESYRLRYRDNPLLGGLSAIGSHVLSLQFLALYGRYVSDTLSGARAIRTADALGVPCLLTDKLVNQYLLAGLLRRHAEILEIPVQFFAISPDQVRRTTVADGLRSVMVAVSRRFRA